MPQSIIFSYFNKTQKHQVDLFNLLVRFAMFFILTAMLGCGNAKEENSGASASPGVSDTSLTPVITSFSSPHYSGTGNYTISGTCISDTQIKLIGDSNIITTCAGGLFNFNISFSTDGVYSFIIRAENLFNHNTATTELIWYVDGTPPAVPTISSPTSNPFSSSSNSVTFMGSCEVDAVVSYSESPGGTTGTQTCLTGSYYFISSKSVDGNYVYSIKQTDVAGNQSNTSTFTWQRNSTLLAAPIVTTVNSVPVAGTFYLNTNSITLSGTCPTGPDYTVFFEDLDNSINNSSVVCSTGAFSFVVNKTIDKTYNFGFYTVYTVNGSQSSVTNQTVVRDTSAPMAPVISTPATSPYTSSGDNLTITVSCELNALVNLVGDDTQSAICTSTQHSFVIAKTIDGIYNFIISQTDRAGNASGSVAQQWNRSSFIPVTPTITTPANSPLSNNAGSITIAGACTAGLKVTLTDVVAGTTTAQTCANGSGTSPYDGNYSFNIIKSLDNSYTFNIKQSTLSSDSGNATQVWNKDAVAPTITISSGPVQPTNYTANVSFSFSTNDPSSTTYCKVNSNSPVVCTSPFNTSLASSGAYTVTIYGVDAAGNSGLGVSGKEAQYSWSQNVNKTIAGFNFENNFTSISGDNNAEAVGTGNFSSAEKKFNSYSLQVTSSAYARVQRVNQNKISRITNPATMEAFVKLPDMPAGGIMYPIVSKNGATSGNFGWEFGINKSGGTGAWMYIKLSCDGVNIQTIQTTSKINLDRTIFQHLAVAISGSNVYFFFDGVAMAAASGITGGGCNSGNNFALFDAPVDLYIGANASGATLNGNRPAAYIDALRISQVDRTSGGSSAANLCRGASMCVND